MSSRLWGVFLFIAARNPLEHLNLTWFTVWSSVVHGVIMRVQPLVDSAETDNRAGGVPALLLLAQMLR